MKIYRTSLTFSPPTIPRFAALSQLSYTAITSALAYLDMLSDNRIARDRYCALATAFTALSQDIC